MKYNRMDSSYLKKDINEKWFFDLMGKGPSNASKNKYRRKPQRDNHHVETEIIYNLKTDTYF